MVAARDKSRFKLPEGLGAQPKRRPIRVAEAIRNELSALLLYKVKDPALRNVTLVHVDVSKDLSCAKIYYVARKESREKIVDGLNRAKGFMRSYLAKELQMRYVPDLLFYYDNSVEYDEKMQKILQEIAREDESGSR